jgi:hypothetical protein
MTKKFTYDDLQPHVEMLIEALLNKGSCASGLPYAEGVTSMAQYYQELLSKIRNKTISYDALIERLDDYRYATLFLAKNNQLDRITKIVNALDSYIKKEYTKVNI